MLPVRYLTLVMAALAIAVVSYAMPRTASAGGSCHPGSGVSTERGTLVTMSENCFVATVLRVDEGATVTFLNEDPVVHSVTGVAWTWGDETPIAEGESVQHVFDENGIYVYTCLLHPGMAGAIVVGDGSGNGPSAAAPRPDDDGRAVSNAAVGDAQPASDPAASSARLATDDRGASTSLIAAAIAVGIFALVALAAASMALTRAAAARRQAAR